MKEKKSRSGQVGGSRIGTVTWKMRRRSVDILAPGSKANAKLNGP